MVAGMLGRFLSQGVQASRPSSHHRSACLQYAVIVVVAVVGGHVTSRQMVPTVCLEPATAVGETSPCSEGAAA